MRGEICSSQHPICVLSLNPSYLSKGFPGSSAGKESTCNAGDPGSIPGRRHRLPTPVFTGFPGSSQGKGSARNAGDLGSIPGLRRSPGGGHGRSLQYSCLGNPQARDAGAWWAAVRGVPKCQTRRGG